MEEKHIRLRIRWGDESIIWNDLEKDTSLKTIKERIGEWKHVNSNDLQLKVGFPPKLLKEDDWKSLQEVGIQHGDTILVDLKNNSTILAYQQPTIEGEEQEMKRNMSPDTKLREKHANAGCLVRRVMKDDNSCLFHAISYVLENKKMEKVNELRATIASVIVSDPLTYTEAMLGRSPEAYCQWIMQSTSWGGGIELAIFSLYYQIEIIAVNIQTLRLDRFGEDQHYPQRVLVIYDGIHYDALARIAYSKASANQDITVFSADDELVVAQALSIASELKRNKQFTDVANFSLKCSQCSQGLYGQKGAQEHALRTGHTRFVEYTHNNDTS